MATYKLSDIRNKLSNTTSDTVITLATVLESSPEPTTTSTGVAPGQALFDTPSPGVQESEPIPCSQRSQRPRTSTERGALYSESREKSRERSEKIQRTKKRKSRKTQGSKNATGNASNVSTGGSDSGSGLSSSEDGSVSGVYKETSASVQLANHSADDASNPATIGGSKRSGASKPLERRNGSVCAPNTKPIAASDAASDASGNSDNNTNIDPVQLAAELSKRLDYDCSGLSMQDIQAILRAVIADQTPAVESPQRKAKILKSSSQQIKVGSGNHLDRLNEYRYNTPGPAKRTSTESIKTYSKRQKISFEGGKPISHTESKVNFGSETEPGSKTESEIDVRQPKPTRTIRPLFRPSNSPTPLPPSHVPIDPEVIDLLDLPAQSSHRETLDTATEASTTILEDTLRPQDSVSQQITRSGLAIRHSTTQRLDPQMSATSIQIPSAQRPHILSQSSSTRHEWSRSSVSLGQPYCSPPATTKATPGPPPRRASTALKHNRPGRAVRASAPKTASPSYATSVSNPPRTSNAPGQQPQRSNQTRTVAKTSTVHLLQRQRLHKPADQSTSVTKTKDVVPVATGSGRVIDTVSARRRSRMVARHDAAISNNPGITASTLPLPSPRWTASALPVLVPDNEEELVAIDAEVNGEEPRPSKKRKPAARDLFGFERQILTTAKMHLFAYSLVEGPYQTRSTFMQWAGDVYEATWRQELPNVPFERPRARTLQIMVNGMATMRGRVKENLRSVIQHGYDFEKPATLPKTINRNLETFRAIHPNRFHCVEFEPVYGHYEGIVLSEGIAAGIFHGPTAVGVLFRDFFQPIPLPTVAFILANMQFCIEEWEHGFFQPRDLNTADMLNKYIAHYRGLKEARGSAKGRMTRLQEDWFDFGFEYSGALKIDEPYSQPITLRGEVRPDTPPANESESESEPHMPETNDEGRYTTRAKGKNRA